MGGTDPLGPDEFTPASQRAYGPMENRPKSPTQLGEDPIYTSARMREARRRLTRMLAMQAQCTPEMEKGT